MNGFLEWAKRLVNDIKEKRSHEHSWGYSGETASELSKRLNREYWYHWFGIPTTSLAALSKHGGAVLGVVVQLMEKLHREPMGEDMLRVATLKKRLEDLANREQEANGEHAALCLLNREGVELRWRVRQELAELWKERELLCDEDKLILVVAIGYAQRLATCLDRNRLEEADKILGKADEMPALTFDVEGSVVDVETAVTVESATAAIPLATTNGSISKNLAVGQSVAADEVTGTGIEIPDGSQSLGIPLKPPVSDEVHQVVLSSQTPPIGQEAALITRQRGTEQA